ncbi:MAG: class I SAM-dependent methyltransferase [Opitutaceae bacterium]|nr:class I SAM-dependent methyltransferase [Opitutaceae bacterium]
MPFLSRHLRLALHRTWWNRLAHADPYWAVLTEPGKEGRNWDPQAFFLTGTETVAAEIHHLKTRGIELRFDHALDFGCGLGRLTNGLAGHFAQTTGVDISSTMLKQARQLSRHPDRIRFVKTADPRLRNLPDNAFDFVYSEITLQHIPPAESEVYIASLVRLARPGGAISFQLPASLPPPDPVEQFRFSSWPPTLWRRLQRMGGRLWRQSRHYWQPHMPMYAVPRLRVIALIEAAGARVVEVAPSPSAGPAIESFHYRAVKVAPSQSAAGK